MQGEDMNVFSMSAETRSIKDYKERMTGAGSAIEGALTTQPWCLPLYAMILRSSELRKIVGTVRSLLCRFEDLLTPGCRRRSSEDFRSRTVPAID
ncbi:uncharacterized protein J3R85_011980 [Psidium guajava]|nr:uncharacterized protein J3R85_011980 [Psidium guajava]